MIPYDEHILEILSERLGILEGQSDIPVDQAQLIACNEAKHVLITKYGLPASFAEAEVLRVRNILLNHV